MTILYVLLAGMMAFTQLLVGSVWFLAAVVAAVALIAIAMKSGRVSVHAGVAALLLVASASYSVWALQLGWFLAAVGILMAIAGAVLVGRRSALEERASSGSALVWAGAALLAAPFANVFVLMPALRHLVK